MKSRRKRRRRIRGLRGEEGTIWIGTMMMTRRTKKTRVRTNMRRMAS
ncbi:Os05g0494800 [Oryza sativa Japonica Group]|uniref:Os05g0494800 protein n=1 Tax=Oryza sativa subsp. japonica TaxID=39947 RepID=Q65X76_ORYSJ|nr:unknown protein [Oryza sativa Japonica Group]BAH93200.1 Os05g0494800 [Oryza sativa Japonica Group]|eukprot:NP_001174472.1 Os05g0494800 [Oryza sativa Japonica Group]